MKHYVEHRCASCGTIAGGTTRKRATIGKPFTECGSCGAYVLRPPYDEWDLMSPRTKIEILGTGAVVAALGLLPGVIYGLASIFRGSGSDLLILLIVGGSGLVLALAAWGAWLGRIVRRSQRRMSDPWYQAKLVEFGMQGQER